MAKSLYGMLFAGDKEDIQTLWQKTEEERLNSTVIKELDDSYRNSTFREVVEYMTKDKNSLDTEEKKVTATKAQSYLKQHNGSTFVCWFVAYKQNGNDYVAMNGPDGKEKIPLDQKIAPFIDSRKTSQGDEHDCIDMLCSRTTGQQGWHNKKS